MIASFALFFILGSFLVSYAYGYKFDLDNLKWVKTGGAAVKANADGAKIFIDGRKAGRIPFLSNVFTEKNLLPGRYSLKVEKDGMPSVSKNIEVVSGQVTQLIHVYLPQKEEIADFIASRPEEKPIPYSISGGDGLLYPEPSPAASSGAGENISTEPVYVKNFKLKKIGDDFYLASNDTEAAGLFLLNSEGKWDQIYTRPLIDAVLSPDNKKLALIGENEINVLWLKDESETPYFRQGYNELILRSSQKIEKAFWFKTDWHLIYLTANGETHFLELDPTGGRNNLVI